MTLGAYRYGLGMSRGGGVGVHAWSCICVGIFCVGVPGGVLQCPHFPKQTRGRGEGEDEERPTPLEENEEP